MNYEQIVVEQRGPVVLVTLYRPTAMNAWTWQMSMEMADAFAKADADDAIRAIVVTGHGRSFCAGADLGGGGSTWGADRSRSAIGSAEQAAAARNAKKPYMLKTPIIAAINGAAVGAGLTMPMAWDLRVAADDAKLGFVFNRRGVIPDADLIWLIPRMIGFGPAMDVLLTGRIFLGKEAKELGLVHRSVPREQVLETALEMASDIAANTAPVSAAITKQLMYQFLAETDRTAALQLQRELFAWAGKQADAKEGVTAFLEKRAPQWKLSKTRDLPERLAK
jgi:enoyl-CoA hydratase/carnithine racemase